MSRTLHTSDESLHMPTPSLRTLSLIGLFALAASSALAQPYPARPIRMLVGFPPGGTADVSARVIASRLGQGLGTNVVVEKSFNSNRYKVYLQATNLHPTNDRPTIIAEGWVVHPKTGQFLPRPRVVRVTTTNDALFAKGLVAKGQIDLGGNNIRTDSYDSTIPAYNTGGRYDPARVGDYVAAYKRAVVTDPAATFTVTAAFDGTTIRLAGEVSDRAHHDRLIDLLVAMRMYDIANEVRLPKTPR